MGYWDKKSEEAVAEEQPDMSLGTYEVLAEEKLEEDGEYLSRKMTEHKERFEKVTSDGFWFCVYFNTDDQKEEFLRKLNLEPNVRYLSGKELAKVVGVTIETPNFDFGKEKLPVKEFKDRARPLYQVSEDNKEE